MKHGAVLLIFFLLVGCGQPAVAPTPTSQPTERPAPTATTEPTVEPTATAAPSPTPAPTEAATGVVAPEVLEDPTLEAGWQRYAVGELASIALPEGYYVLDLTEVDPDELASVVEETLPEGNERLADLNVGNLVSQGIRFYALDVARYELDDAIPPSINVIIQEVGDLPLRLVLQATTNQLEQVGAENMVDPVEIELDGRPVGVLEYEMHYEVPLSDELYPLRIKQLLFITQGTMHVITIGYPLDADETHLAEIDTIIERLQIEE